jgi:hypothetical protein
MQALSVLVKRGRYNAYYQRPELLESVFHLFLTEPDANDIMRDVSSGTKFPLTTLYSWREAIRTQPTWRPARNHFSLAPRAFPPDVEAIIADFLGVNFISLGRSLTRSVLRPVIPMLVHDLVAQQVLETILLNFKCSSHYLSNFLRRVGLSFMRARPQSRPVIDDAACAEFVSRLAAAYLRDPPDFILNFDESNWYLVMAGDETVAERGAETVHQCVDGDDYGSGNETSAHTTGTRNNSALPCAIRNP